MIETPIVGEALLEHLYVIINEDFDRRNTSASDTIL